MGSRGMSCLVLTARSADKCKEMKTQVSRDRQNIARLLYKFVFAALVFVFIAVLSSCGEAYPSVTNRGTISEGGEDRANISFAMNGRPVRLELAIRVEGSGALIEIDHPDGRTVDSIEIPGPGIRELAKELPKEPGSWGIRITTRGGTAAYWVALHDRAKYIGPDDDSRRFVERE